MTSRAAPLAILLAVAPGALPDTSLAMAAPERRDGWVVHYPRPSWALESMLRDRIARGEPVPSTLIERFGLDQPPAWAAEADLLAAPAPTRSFPPPALQALGTDRLVNDPAPDAGSCAGCGFLLHIQSETTIAAWGSNLLAGWNDSRGFCDGTSVHGWGWSLDGGATWVDAGGVPPLATGGRYRGDPVHGVNRATGDFYVCGLYEGGLNGSGVACLRGHFSGGTFLVDVNRQIAIGDTSFLDKEWMAVDSLTGNVYVSWTAFNTGNQIWFRAFDSGLSPLGPEQMVSPPAADGLVQGSRPAVGPDGEVYVVWYQYGLPQSEMHVRRSDDFGATFGPDVVVAGFFENGINGAPGFLREFAPNMPSVAVDASNGPNRGRVYVAWDETVDFRDTALGTGSTVGEVENNGFFANPTAFVPGDVLEGTIGAGDVDFFAFSGTAGQTLVVASETNPPINLALRVVCAAETTTFNQYRMQAYTASAAPEICYTLPLDGTYWVRLSPSGSGTSDYSIRTGWDVPSLDQRASHNREKFVAWSDDGSAWSVPVRLDDSQTTDGIYPELAVDDLGRVWCYWHDFRDDPNCGAESFEYVTASGDGGLTWGPNEPLSDVRSFWPPNTCRKPNQGDYQGITAIGSSLVACWADARLGDPDTYVEATAFAVAMDCPGDPLDLPAGGAGPVSFSFSNQGTAARPLSWAVGDDAGWTLDVVPSAGGSASLGPGESQPLDVTVHAPGDCSGAPNRVRLVTWDPLIAGRADTCEVTVTCSPAVAVGESAPARLALSRPRPNPSAEVVSLEFTLPRASHARLEVLGAGGRRIRTLVDAALEPGTRVARWDGRDAAGRRVAPGAYWVRLSAAGEERTQAVMRVR